jgi:hypothetical protein
MPETVMFLAEDVKGFYRSEEEEAVEDTR